MIIKSLQVKLALKLALKVVHCGAVLDAIWQQIPKKWSRPLGPKFSKNFSGMESARTG